jgi:serine/threonine protein kinase
MNIPRAIDLDFLRNVAQQLVDVLIYLHDRDIIHNDIKPANILISDDGVVKLIDYGFAVVSNFDGNTEMFGTAMYTSPEKFQGLYTNGADWYALASTLLEVKNGKHPFGHYKIADQVRRNVFRGLPKLGEPIFDDFIQKIGHVDPDVRWCHANGNIADILNHPFLKKSEILAEPKTQPDTVTELLALEKLSITDGAVATLDDTQ